MASPRLVRSSALAVVLVLGGPSLALAQDGVRQLGAHVHGDAQFSMATDASGTLYAELSSPAWNLYGFEQTTPTEEELATLRRVDNELRNPGILRLPNGAACAHMGTGFEGVAALYHGAANSHGHDHGHGHHHDDHGHDHGHDHGDDDHSHDHHDHSDHNHDHDDHDHGEGHAHQDVVVSWEYLCGDVTLIDAFDASGLFEALPRLERLQADFFDGERAASERLTPAAPVLPFD